MRTDRRARRRHLRWFAPGAITHQAGIEEVSRAKALITVDGARRKGKTGTVKAVVDAAMADVEWLKERIVVVRHTGIDAE